MFSGEQLVLQSKLMSRRNCKSTVENAREKGTDIIVATRIVVKPNI